ncbi:MAG TPA: O-antigen ligase family protein [Patescibacteria group bacterium]|nr:O-antigen ligase family protein [Patescibacteria group bacterium]
MQKLSNIADGIGKYLLAAVLIVVPLFPKFPLLTVPGTYVAIRAEDLLLLFLAVFTFIKVVPNIRNFLKDDIVKAFVIFFGVGAVSLFSGIFLTHTVDPNIGILHWARRIEYVVPFFAALTLLTRQKASQYLDFYIKIILIVIAVAFIYGVGQRYLNFPIIVTQNEEYSKGVALRWTEGSHVNSTFGGHYDLAAYLVLTLPILLSLLVILKDWASRIALFAVSGMGIWLLIASISRIGQLAYFAALSVSLILLKKFKALAIILAISITLAGMSGSLGARFSRVIEVFYERTGIKDVIGDARNGFAVNAQEFTLPASRNVNFVPTPTPVPVFEDRSTSIRLVVEWPRALRALAKNPLIGTGYSSIGLATDNDFLRMLGETGILGLAAFALIFIRIGKEFVAKALPVSKFKGVDSGFVAGIIGGVVGTFIFATFIDIFEASKFATMFWLMLGLGLFYLRSREYD